MNPKKKIKIIIIKNTQNEDSKRTQYKRAIKKFYLR